MLSIAGNAARGTNVEAIAAMAERGMTNKSAIRRNNKYVHMLRTDTLPEGRDVKAEDEWLSTNYGD